MRVPRYSDESPTSHLLQKCYRQQVPQNRLVIGCEHKAGIDALTCPNVTVSLYQKSLIVSVKPTDSMVYNERDAGSFSFT